MEGQAEVASVDKETGKPLNGTLKYQLSDPRTAAEFAPTDVGQGHEQLDRAA